MTGQMTDRIADSVLYRHLWGTDEARAVLGEEGRLAGWLEVITALARVQAEAGLIPVRAAELIGTDARDCVYVGDAVTDVQAGQAAGMATVGVTWGASSRTDLAAAAPTIVVDRVDQLTEWLVLRD